MSNDSSKEIAEKPAASTSVVPWNPWLAVIFGLFTFLAAQIVAGLVISLYPLSQHWTAAHTSQWLRDSLVPQVSYLTLSSLLIMIALYLFIKPHKIKPSLIGLRRPKWSDPLYGLAALPAYLILMVLTVAAASALLPGLDVDQKQELGFNGTYQGWSLLAVFVSLVILPPITEEIMMRGFVYSSFKKAVSLPLAVLFTSGLFAAAHLAEGGASGPLYIAAIDTFVLSLVLIFLREVTRGLWASITLHALKNGIAFLSLFVLHAR